MKKLVRMLCILVALGAVFIFMAGCEEGYREYEEYEEEPFDFSEHMRIDDCFVELMERDISEFEMTNLDEWRDRGIGIQIRGFENTNEFIAEERKIRVKGGG